MEESKTQEDAYISGLVVGIELALLNPEVARSLADQMHSAASHGDTDLRDELFDKAGDLACDLIMAHLTDLADGASSHGKQALDSRRHTA